MSDKNSRLYKLSKIHAKLVNLIVLALFARLVRIINFAGGNLLPSEQRYK